MVIWNRVSINHNTFHQRRKDLDIYAFDKECLKVSLKRKERRNSFPYRDVYEWNSLWNERKCRAGFRSARITLLLGALCKLKTDWEKQLYGYKQYTRSRNGPGRSSWPLEDLLAVASLSIEQNKAVYFSIQGINMQATASECLRGDLQAVLADICLPLIAGLFDVLLRIWTIRTNSSFYLADTAFLYVHRGNYGWSFWKFSVLECSRGWGIEHISIVLFLCTLAFVHMHHTMS